MNFVHSLLNLLLFVQVATWATADEDPQRATFDVASIAIATPDSTTFAFVNSTECDPEAIATMFKLYERNMMVFQKCVDESEYQIFPFSGTFPTAPEIEKMANSLACRAILSSALLAGVPECNIGGFPLHAGAETQLKITVDVKNHQMNPTVLPSTERYVDLLYWRRDVNLAEAAGLPCDSKYELYSEYANNLYTLTTDGLVRLTTGMKVEYRPDVDSPFSQEMIMALPELPVLRGSGSDDGVVGSLSESTTDDTVTAETPETVPSLFPPADEAEYNGVESLGWKKAELAVFVLAVTALLV